MILVVSGILTALDYGKLSRDKGILFLGAPPILGFFSFSHVDWHFGVGGAVIAQVVVFFVYYFWMTAVPAAAAIVDLILVRQRITIQIYSQGLSILCKDGRQGRGVLG